jgi:hypothetical protein
LIRRPGDLPEGGDERLKNMQQVVPKPHSLPVQLRISANYISEPDDPSIRNHFDQAYQEDSLPSKISEAVRTQDSLKEITIAECTEQDGQVWYRGKRCVPEADQLRLRLIQEHPDTA